jgi:hypothetical protein
MSLTTALEFAKRGYAVVPVGPNKRPWLKHGVHSASSNPLVVSRWDWHGAACAVATGELVEVLDIDLRDADAQSRGTQENPSAPCVDGFATLKSIAFEWDLIQTLTLCARTPSGGVHAWWKPFSGRSRTLAAGVEWFSKGKYVVVPPAPGRAWLNELPVAEAPEELKRILLARNGGVQDRHDSSAYFLAGPGQATSSAAQGPLFQSPPCNAFSRAAQPTLCDDDHQQAALDA